MARRDVSLMWAEACALLAQAERLQKQFFQAGATAQGAPPAWEAPADIFERGPELTVCVALPGVAPENVEVALEGSWLRVAGFRRLKVTQRTVIRRLEIPHGRFERRIELPAANYAIEALETIDGCVHLHLIRR